MKSVCILFKGLTFVCLKRARQVFECRCRSAGLAIGTFETGNHSAAAQLLVPPMFAGRRVFQEALPILEVDLRPFAGKFPLHTVPVRQGIGTTSYRVWWP